MPLNLNYDAFLEVLLNCIKNSVISYQSNFLKSTRKKQKELSKSLNSLKCGNVRDESVLQKIIEIENALCKIEDEENYRRMESSEYFQILNSEKA